MNELQKKENQQSRSQNDGVLVAQRTVEQFSGPIPPPNALAQYEAIHAGLADRIMKMAESQSEHRKGIETKVILHDSVKSMLGLIFAFVIVIVAILAGVYLVIKGQQWVGAFFSFLPLGAIVGAFIYQQRGREKE